jgi:hypothetical protein
MSNALSTLVPLITTSNILFPAAVMTVSAKQRITRCGLFGVRFGIV